MLLQPTNSIKTKFTSMKSEEVMCLVSCLQLITRSCAEASTCARAPHNAAKNRPRAALPPDAARVLLVPKPGVEGSCIFPPSILYVIRTQGIIRRRSQLRIPESLIE